MKPEILDALKSQRPVVALESTIITHGMPYPHNVETAVEVEEIVRREVCTQKRVKMGMGLKKATHSTRVRIVSVADIRPTRENFYQAYL